MDKPVRKTDDFTPEQVEKIKGLKRRLVEDWFSSSGNRSVKGKAPIEPRHNDDDRSSGNRSVKAKAPIEPRGTDDDDDNDGVIDVAVEVMIIKVMCSADFNCDASSGGDIDQGDSQFDMKITESVSELPCGEGKDGCSIHPKAALNTPACGQGQGDRKKRRLAETR
ncbi:hypothetical protein LWI29_027577 [Acer saccharum]|uniref:Uncharacterized protein n=1 Tax=Acer saccharum TaxID=4024 RepID=A0AA39SN11_ACESA|nr:hypothetical protein LWI29_027577 [Acer saccharum]